MDQSEDTRAANPRTAPMNRRAFGRTLWAAGAAATLLTLTGCPGGGDGDDDDDGGDDDD